MDLTCHQCFSVYVDICLGLIIHLYQQYFCHTNARQRISKKKKNWADQNSTLLNKTIPNLNIVFHPSKVYFLPLVALTPCLFFDKLFSPSLHSVPKPGLPLGATPCTCSRKKNNVRLMWADTPPLLLQERCPGWLQKRLWSLSERPCI